MKTFERLYLTKKNEEEIESTEKQISGNLQEIFKQPETGAGKADPLQK